MCSKDDTQNVELDEGAQEILRMLRSERICARRRGVGGRILSNAHIASGVLQVLVTDERDMPADPDEWARERLEKLESAGLVGHYEGFDTARTQRWFITDDGVQRGTELGMLTHCDTSSEEAGA